MALKVNGVLLMRTLRGPAAMQSELWESDMAGGLLGGGDHTHSPVCKEQTIKENGKEMGLSPL